MQVTKDLGAKVESVADGVRKRRTRSKLDEFADENHRLRSEIRVLRSDLDRESRRQERILEMLDRLANSSAKAVRKSNGAKRRGRWLGLVVIGGTAYMFGAKAGRARYRQIQDWLGRAADTMDKRTDVLEKDATDRSSTLKDPPAPMSETEEITRIARAGANPEGSRNG